MLLKQKGLRINKNEASNFNIHRHISSLDKKIKAKYYSNHQHFASKNEVFNTNRQADLKHREEYKLLKQKYLGIEQECGFHFHF